MSMNDLSGILRANTAQQQQQQQQLSILTHAQMIKTLEDSGYLVRKR